MQSIICSQLLKRVWEPLTTTVRNHPYPMQFGQHLRNQPQVQSTVLPNGLTVASQERESFNACIGLYFDAGSRNEALFENGIAHFFEHIAFKSTQSREKTVLEEVMSTSGARFRCFTTREMAVYYVECLSPDVPSIVELLAECIFTNKLCPKEIENQKKIVFAEMIEHEQNSQAVLLDYLHSTAFQGTPLSQTVMGLSTNLYNFSASTLSNYLKKWFDPTKTVFAGVGGVKHEQLVSLANSYLRQFEPNKIDYKVGYRFTASDVRFRNDDLPVANVAVAVEAPSYCDTHDSLVMDIAATLLGGWDRSQYAGRDHPLNIAQAGSLTKSCDSFKAFYLKYSDTGLWGVMFMSPPLKQEDMLYIVQNEFMKLCTCITEPEVQRARRQLKTKILSTLETCQGTCHDLGKSFLYRDKYVKLDALLEQIDGIHDFEVKAVCDKFIYDKCPVVAAVGACEGLPEYNRVRGGMYWLRL